MKNQSRILKNGSKAAAASQPKTAQNRAATRPASQAPDIAHFPEDGSPSCLCLYDARVGELAGEIPLVGRELYSAVVAAYRQHITIDQFIADAIREKLERAHPNASTSESVQIAVEVLVNLAVRKVHGCPIDEQIVIWKALSKTLPDSAAREHAGQIAKLQSEVAARHLQFKDILSGQAAQPTDQRRTA
jgi:hypothetical protein